jgi:hypothetical protein
MSFVNLSEIVMMLLCSAVVVQTMRLMRALRTMRDGGLSAMIGALDRATGEAREVLSEMKLMLADSASASKVVADGRDMAEELGVMIGIANASAERLLEAASNRSSGAGADVDAAATEERQAEPA